MSPTNGRPRHPTLKDVARRASVSTQTISRVINNKGEVATTTRQRVLDAISELGYQPNSLARSLVKSQSLVIGLVVPDISQPFYPEIARGVEDEASKAGYSVFLCNVAGDPARELQALDRLRGHRAAGVIICSSRLDDEALARAIGGFTPVVLVHRDLPNVGGSVIWPGYDVGSTLAVDHLVATGRRRIAYLGLDEEDHADKDKLRGYQAALQRAGIPFDSRRVVSAARTFQGGYDAMEAIVDQQIDVDAIFAFNDPMAIGVLRYAATHDIAVPEDLAVIGFGGSDIAGMVTPALSTIAVPLHTIGVTAGQELFDLIHRGGQELRHVRSEPRLLVRESTVRNDTSHQRMS